MEPATVAAVVWGAPAACTTASAPPRPACSPAVPLHPPTPTLPALAPPPAPAPLTRRAVLQQLTGCAVQPYLETANVMCHHADEFDRHTGNVAVALSALRSSAAMVLEDAAKDAVTRAALDPVRRCFGKRGA